MSDDEEDGLLDHDDDKDDDGGFSAKTMCIGLCGVGPALLWVLVLAYIAMKTSDKSCAVGGNIFTFISVSLLGYIALVAIQVVNGMCAGEPDFDLDPIEKLTVAATLLVAILIFIWNYYGCVQVVSGDLCDDGLKSYGWTVLIGNNIVWFMTLFTMVGGLVASAMVAGTDTALNKVGMNI